VTIDELLAAFREGSPPSSEQALERLIDAAPPTFDLAGDEDQRRSREVAELLGALVPDAARLRQLEVELAAREPAVPLLVQLGVKLARSRRVLASLTEPVHLSVVFAVYGEHNRVRTRDEHPNGEDFLVRKVEQLDALCRGTSSTFELIAVDDGCPHGSGRIVAEIAESRDVADRVRVLFLEEAIAAGHTAVAGLSAVDESRKGGSIHLGWWTAAAESKPGDVVVFTDADLSTHLGQVGLLVEPIRAGASAAIGDRRDPSSVVVKQGKRDDRGKLFIYLWKRMLPQLTRIVDTQCGFKAFDARLLQGLVVGAIEKRFAFDIELMLRTELQRSHSIAKVPVAWIDSEAESTTSYLQPYLDMIQSVAAMYRHYLPPDESAEAFATLVESMEQDDWQRLVDDIPTDITRREPAEFSELRCRREGAGTRRPPRRDRPAWSSIAVR
jgi:hypothetical protein